MKIDSYKKKYQEQIFDIILNIKVNEEKIRYIPRHDLWTIPKSFLCFYVVIHDRQVIGCIGLKKIDKDSVLLSRFYVKAEFRRIGIGEKLFNKVLIYAKKHNFNDMYVGVDNTSQTGLNFYNKHGFVEISEGKYISQDDDFTLYKKI